jgi:molybdopterin biosynthesis enzyme
VSKARLAARLDFVKREALANLVAMISVSAALGEIRSRARQLDAARLPLDEALGCTLREDAREEADSPPFDASAMDGYAVRRADCAGTVRIVGTSAAGAGFSGSIARGECVRIFTGAPLPGGADWVVRQEDASREGDTLRVVHRPDSNYIRRQGENRRAGEVIVPAFDVMVASYHVEATATHRLEDLATDVLATNLPVRHIFAVLAVCPAVFAICIYAVGRMHSRILGREALAVALQAL